MKKNKRSLLYLLIVLFFLFTNSSYGFLGFGSKDIDRINKYYITVEPRNDATLDITYDIEWEILDKNETYLDVVKIGVPNEYYDSVRVLTSNIAKIEKDKTNPAILLVYFRNPDDGVRKIDFKFSIHQKNICTVNNDVVRYSFTPGWFDEIEVKDIKVFWNAKGVQTADSSETNSDGYYVWGDKLKKGEKLNVNLTYPKSNFKITKSSTKVKVIPITDDDITKTINQFSSAFNLPIFGSAFGMGSVDQIMNSMYSLIRLGFMLVVFCIVFAVISAVLSLGRGYDSHRGYGYGYRYRRYWDDDFMSNSRFGSSSSFSGKIGGRGCACACAGGGRAGCSKKDFYGTNIKTINLKNILTN